MSECFAGEVMPFKLLGLRNKSREKFSFFLFLTFELLTIFLIWLFKDATLCRNKWCDDTQLEILKIRIDMSIIVNVKLYSARVFLMNIYRHWATFVTPLPVSMTSTRMTQMEKILCLQPWDFNNLSREIGIFQVLDFMSE